MSKSATEYLFWANPKSIANSFEQVFYDEHASLFNVKTSQFNENRSIFDIIKSTSILLGLENRKHLNEDYLQFPAEQLKRLEIQSSLLEQLPYIEDNGERIYIPTYSREINAIYHKHPDMLKQTPYDIYTKDENEGVINPFETYGFLLLESPFTKLIRIKAKSPNVRVYYHIDFETLFFVREDLSLELELPILDEKVTRIDRLSFFDDLSIVADDYFDGDIKKMFRDLKDRKFLSASLYEECMWENEKYEKRMKKHAV
jgi:hypothetical protein